MNFSLMQKLLITSYQETHTPLVFYVYVFVPLPNGTRDKVVYSTDDFLLDAQFIVKEV